MLRVPFSEFFVVRNRYRLRIEIKRKNEDPFFVFRFVVLGVVLGLCRDETKAPRVLIGRGAGSRRTGAAGSRRKQKL